MPERNRVTPYGDIVAIPLRGNWLGNRGIIHRGHEIVRGWACKHWITCALEFKGWVAPKWAPNRWTALFFYDEAVALAAGHRPCALCRRADYRRFLTAASMQGAEALDTRLHAERLDGRRKRKHAMPWRELPAGAFVEVDGSPCVVLDDRIQPWSREQGYGEGRPRPVRGDAVLLTPPTTIAAIRAGYVPQIGQPIGKR